MSFFDECLQQLQVTGGWSERLERIMEEKQVNDVRISRFLHPSLDPLRKYAPQIKRLIIEDQDLTDLAALNDFRGLEFLSVGPHVGGINLSSFPSLKECGLDWNEQDNLAQSDTIIRFEISGYRGRDLSALSGLRKLQDLFIDESRLHTLSGLENLVRLEKLEIGASVVESLDDVALAQGLQEVVLGDLPRLVVLKPLCRLPNLRRLVLAHCKRISDISVVKEMRGLEELLLISMGKFETLIFVRLLENLRVLELRDGTTLAHGDLRFLLDLPKLERVYFEDKRHYSHTLSQITDLLRQQQERPGATTAR